MSKKKLAIDMTPEELEQWLETLKIEDTVPIHYFSNPDPYFKVSPSANEKPRNYWFGKDGHLHVKNISAYWIPELTLTKEIKGTIYTVSGSYEGTEMLGATTNKITAIYCRLSQEDERLGESLSIEHQKAMLLQYAKEHHFPNPVFFVDDGYSGTNYDRPGFQSMLDEIEAGNVAIALSKDLSRLGRNSALTGLHTNFTFPQHGVRYIAITDNYDTADPNSINNDFAGNKNWFNEFYARDTSCKIRAVNRAKGERGEPLTVHVPYGYKKDPEKPKHWIVDDEAALVVKRIFQMAMEGRGPSQIATQLTKDEVLMPTAYKQMQGRNTPHPTPVNPCRWQDSTIVNILERREYTGCTVNFKTYTNSIWDKKTRKTPIEDQAVFYGTHEAIITLDVFDKVQELRKQRHRRSKTGKTSLFFGLVYCADCGEKMYYCTTKNFEKRQDFFECSVHHKHKEDCKTHFIRAVVLEDFVWMHMKAVISYILRYESHFRVQLQERMRLESEVKIRAWKQQLAQAQKRIFELDRLFIKIYEDNASGKLSDERFSMMSVSYEAEQKRLKEDVQQSQQDIEVQERQNENLEKFIQKVHKYEDLTGLTQKSRRDLVSAIYVGAPDKSSGKRRQSIHIKYDGIGFIPLDELMKLETA